MIRKYGPGVLAIAIVLTMILLHQFVPANPLFNDLEEKTIISLSHQTGAVAATRRKQTAEQRLGKALFFDPRLSKNGQLSCASCHNPEKNWADGRPKSMGLEMGSRNTPSLWNVRDNRWFFWDGRADSRWSQALKPIESPIEMGGNRLSVYHLINNDAKYAQLYAEAFGISPRYTHDADFPANGCPSHHNLELKQHWNALDTVEKSFVNDLFVNVGKAIAAFEALIVSDSSRFDQYALGVKTGDDKLKAALNENEQIGLKLFIIAGCINCHNGPDFTDKEFHNIRLPQLTSPPDSGRASGIRELFSDPFNGLSNRNDPGFENPIRFIRQVPRNFGEFKTPSLRNVTRTAPYMHDGRFATLEEVLAYYNTLKNAADTLPGAETVLQPLFLNQDELKDLLLFLSTLEDSSMEFLHE
ncbi:MAG: cytochrome-c peroxidase [Saprospiraceae bacterium]